MRSSAGASPSHHTLDQHRVLNTSLLILQMKMVFHCFKFASLLLFTTERDDLLHHIVISKWYSISFLWISHSCPLPIFLFYLGLFLKSILMNPIIRTISVTWPLNLGFFFFFGHGDILRIR